MRTAYESELRELQQRILRMGGIAEEAIAESIQSLQKQDLDLAEKVIATDDTVDRLDLEIENHCIRLIALQHPLASDLRVVTSIMRIAIDIERLADYATNIAEIALKIGKAPLIKPLEDIPRMARSAQSMVGDSLDAFVSRDVAKARDVCLRDETVDKIYSDIHDELMMYITTNQDPVNVEQAANLLFVARYLERIADHGTNIGERVIFMVTGVQEKY